MRSFRYGGVARALIFFTAVLVLGVHAPGSISVSWADASRVHAERTVGSVEQFSAAMRQHRLKVKVLALDILARNADTFPVVSADVLARYIETVHDVGKLEPKTATKLFRYWGVDISRLPEAEKQVARSVVDALNGEEKIAADAFFRSRGIDAKTRLQFEAIEKLADGIDRWGAKLSLEEFNRAAMRPTSEFLQDEALRLIARDYESSGGALYSKLTHGMHYEDVKRSSRSVRTRPHPPARMGSDCIAGSLRHILASGSRAPVDIARERFEGALAGVTHDVQRAARSAMASGELQRREVFRVMSAAEYKALRSKNLSQKVVWSGTHPEHLYKYGDRSDVLVRFEGWTVPYAPGAKEAEHLLLVEGARVLGAKPLGQATFRMANH